MGSPVLRTVGLVAGRELRVRLRSRGFRITLVVLVVLVVGMSVVLHLVKGGTTIRTVGLLRADAGLSAPVRAAGAAAGEPVTIRQPAGRAQAVAEVRSGALSGFVESTPSGLAVTVDRQLDGTMRGALGGVARELVLDRQIRALGGDPAKVAAAAGAAGVKVEALRPRGGEHTQRMVLGIVAGLLLYGSFMMAGPMIAQGVVEEKSSRVVELLLATMRPGRLMVGKVLGIGALGLIQLVVVGGAGLAAADATGTLTLPLGNSLGTLGWCLVWFLAGFALYSLLFAAAGALVSRQEDLGGVQFPVIMPIIAAWVIGISILPGNPDSGGVAALSMVPFLSPVLMPMRLAIGSVPVWQSAVSLGLTLLLAAAMVRVAARIYRNSVLRSGARVSWREALARGA
jgi:ABC-2 type transport system permease protein